MAHMTQLSKIPICKWFDDHKFESIMRGVIGLPAVWQHQYLVLSDWINEVSETILDFQLIWSLNVILWAISVFTLETLHLDLVLIFAWRELSIDTGVIRRFNWLNNNLIFTNSIGSRRRLFCNSYAYWSALNALYDAFRLKSFKFISDLMHLVNW